MATKVRQNTQPAQIPTLTKSEKEIMQKVIKSARQEIEILYSKDPKAGQYIKTLKRLELKVS
jgi:hypothetical protein